MTKASEDILQATIEEHPMLSSCQKDIESAFYTLIASYRNNGKTLLCGNGGSAADCDHIAGELLKGFLHIRPINDVVKFSLLNFGAQGSYIADKLQSALPCISLTSHTALNLAFSNDVDPLLIFAQQTLAFGNRNDVLWALSTSGNAENVHYAVVTAKAIGMKTIGLTGKEGGKLLADCDVCICVPDDRTYRVQEYHIPVYHALCAMLESEMFTC